MFEVSEKQKRFAVDGTELVSFDLPGLEDKLHLRVSSIGQVQIDMFSLRVVLAESEKAFARMQRDMEKAVEESYRNGMRDGHAAATSTPEILAEGAL